MPQNNGLLVVISGPSGVGKSTIARAICQRLDIVLSVSMTTRKKTNADREGIDYHFVDTPTFEKAIAENQLLEYAKVFGNYYGTPRQPVEQNINADKIVLLEIDVQGAISIRKSTPNAHMIFILPPDENTLLQRLRSRARESEEKIQQRFKECQRETSLAESSNVYNDFIINDDLETAINQTINSITSARQ